MRLLSIRQFCLNKLDCTLASQGTSEQWVIEKSFTWLSSPCGQPYTTYPIEYTSIALYRSDNGLFGTPVIRAHSFSRFSFATRAIHSSYPCSGATISKTDKMAWSSRHVRDATEQA